MIIYSHTSTPRLQYVVDFLSAYYNTPIRLVFDEEKYLAHPDPHRINYSYHRLRDDEIWIHSHVLLFESAVRLVKIECFEQRGYKAFFQAEGDTGFDLLAAVFYLLTRYEEYLPHQKDEYGRFAHQASLAFREGFLHLPLINIWLEDFRALLSEKFDGVEFERSRFRLQLTYDIDIAWSYQHKGFLKNAGGITKLFIGGKWRTMLNRVNVVRNKAQDPYDAYDWMDELHSQWGMQPLYFFLVAEQKGKYDKNIDVSEPAFQSLIKDTAAKYKIGLHPSWYSGDHPACLKKEKTWLEKTSGQIIIASRQHYIRFHLPTTYRQLLSAEIVIDYSMGYGSINGFRASVATSFYWYDLKAEITSPLRIHPFCFMDANAFFEEKKTADEALRELITYADVVRSVGGEMITIWHNNFLGTDPLYEGWKEAYEHFVKATASEKADRER